MRLNHLQTRSTQEIQREGLRQAFRDIANKVTPQRANLRKFALFYLGRSCLRFSIQRHQFRC